LIYEAKLYKLIQGHGKNCMLNQTFLGIPKIYWHGAEGDYNIMVMERLGINLEELLIGCNKRFSLCTTLLIAIQILNIIQHIHSRFYIHRDIKPENFVVGRDEKSNRMYIIDFGLAKRYEDPLTNLHIPYRDNKSLTGTARYASINTHMGIEQSRRDDIESFGYCLVYFLKGALPWQGVYAENKRQKYTKIMDIKVGTPIGFLCNKLPSIFLLIFV